MEVQIMGILNVTPDSFSDGGRFATPEKAVAHGLRLAEEGADILDIGGESTRPGSKPVPLEEELRRTIPVIQALRQKTKIQISIDTQKSEVARLALEAGASIINDVSAGTNDPEMFVVAAQTRATICLMHKRGMSETMQNAPQYRDVIAEVYDYLKGRIQAATESKIARDKIWIDPGFGFGKRFEDNVALLNHLDRFHSLEAPVLVGTSRKSFLGELLGGVGVSERLEAGLATLAIAVQKGARIVRVHDVAQTRRFLTVFSLCHSADHAMKSA